MPKDYYETLGVSRSTSQDEVKKAYRQLAKKYHPDRNKGDKAAEERFKEISQAYDILGDPEKRKKYDQFGHWAEQDGFDPRHQAHRTHTWTSGPGGSQGNFDFDLGEIFGDMFGMGGGQRRSARRGFGGGFGQEEIPGEDIQSSLEIAFEEAIRGTTRRISINRGGGSDKIDVKIPVGIRDGEKIRLAGKGVRGGDLYITISVNSHPTFKRENDDLFMEVSIPFTEAILGTTIRVPTPVDGKAVNLKVPAGTSSGQKFRIPGKGVPRRDQNQGDQYVVIRIVIPPDLDEESKAAIRKIQEKFPKTSR